MKTKSKHLTRHPPTLRPRGPVLQTGDAFDGITRHPFADGARTDACGSSGGLRRLSACHLHDDSLSTNRRQAGIVVDVHPVLLWNTEASQPKLPRSGPDEQPMESSQLAAERQAERTGPRLLG